MSDSDQKFNLSVAYNWNLDLVEEIAKNKYPVSELFASAQHSVIGGGRPASILPKTDNSMMKKHIKKIHQNGMKFSYALNAPCLGAQEFHEETHVKMIKELEWINKAGVDGVIVSIPYILEIIKEQFPELSVRVSTIAKVNSVTKAKSFERLGADAITIDVMINRNFKVLEKMVKNVNCDFHLLVTDGCLFECPYRIYHYNLSGHMSQTYSKREYIDYPITCCTIDKFSNPTEIMKCRWVRPEDMTHYEDIGIHTFKIGGRRLSVPRIMKSVKAYSERKYDGNLVDIVQGFSFTYGGVAETDTSQIHDKDLNPELNTNLIIDNTKLDGFIDFFKKQDCDAECGTCKYCEEWAKKAIVMDEEGVEIFLDSLLALREDLVTSREFGLNKDKKKKRKDKRKFDWDTEAKKNFDTIINGSPKATRGMARMVIGSLAKKKARKRGSKVVENTDVAKAFLEGVPGPFQGDLKQNLIDLGIYEEK